MINLFSNWCCNLCSSLIWSYNKHIINTLCQIQKKWIRVEINLVSTLSKHLCNISCSFNSFQVNISWVTFNSFTEILCWLSFTLCLNNRWSLILHCLFNKEFCSFSLLLCNLFLFNCVFELLTELQFYNRNIIKNNEEISKSFF